MGNPSTPLPSERPFPTWAAATCLGLAAAAHMAPLPPVGQMVGVHAGFLVLVGGTLWNAGDRARTERGNRAGWFTLMAGYLVAAIGGYSSPPLGFLWWAASAWLQGAGWLCFDHGNPDPTSPTHRESSRSLIDGAISALSLFLLMWATFLRERLDGSDLPLAWKASLLLLFLSAAGVLGVLAHALAKGSRVWQGPAGASAAAFLAMGFLAPLWLESRAFLLPVWFGLFLTTRLSWPLPSVGEERAGLPIQDLLPFLPALVAFLAVLAHDFRAHPGTNSVGLGLFVGVALLVTARQFLTLRDLRDLNQELEERVQVRTRDLAGSQSLMLKTQRMNLVASLGAGLVHDVNHLVEAGIDYADQLGGDLKKGVAPRVEDLESVETALARANSLTSQLMGFAREKEAVTEVMDVTDQLQNLGPLLRILVPKGIALAVEPHFEPVLIRSNPSQFDQVIVNLVSNAKDATPPGGMVRINCWVSGPPDSAEAAIEVSDTGFGMSPEMIEKVFDPFFTTKSPRKGTGLGLSSVKSVIEGVQGRIEIDSEPGVGTVCRLFIPLVEERVGLSRPIP